jgi:hypothetical protein
MLLALLIAAALPPQEAQVRPQQATGSDPRSQRPWVLSLEAGWNSLGGVGVVVARHVHPHFTLEAGLGLSGEGPKIGARGRYNFLVQEATMFVGAGFLYGSGMRGTSRTSTYTVGPSPFLQAITGLEYQSRRGFNFLGAVGYAVLLEKNLTTTGGPAGVDALTGGGLVLSASVGYAF